MKLDVRSPGEFAKGHIPGARNLPLFSDDERALVGTTYKQVGQQEAFLLGLEIVGPKLKPLVEEALTLDSPLTVYCWRGGMRSRSVAQLLQAAGLQVERMEGGYKTYRHQVLHTLAQPRELYVIGGPTGVGKTRLLHDLKAAGEAILDLEALANHKGSSYGSQGAQPTQEHFENLLADALGSDHMWVEDESRMIGILRIPDPIFEQMQAAPLYLLDAPKEERLEHLIREYGTLPKEHLIEATTRLRKRLGGLRVKEALKAFEQGNLQQAAAMVLDYYDKTYRHCLSKRKGQVFA